MYKSSYTFYIGRLPSPNDQLYSQQFYVGDIVDRQVSLSGGTIPERIDESTNRMSPSRVDESHQNHIQHKICHSSSFRQ